jgi:hypothetical protein
MGEVDRVKKEKSILPLYNDPDQYMWTSLSGRPGTISAGNDSRKVDRMGGVVSSTTDGRGSGETGCEESGEG